MRGLSAAAMVFCLLGPSLAFAQEETRTEAMVTVVSIDHKARSMAFEHTVLGTTFHGSGTWNAKTKWVDASKGWDKEVPATEKIAATIAKGSRIYVEERNKVIELVRLVPPES